MVLDYVWMFIACLFNIVAYVPLYFVLRGNLVLDGWQLRRPQTLSDRAILNKSNRLALKMLMYALLSPSVWSGLSNHSSQIPSDIHLICTHGHLVVLFIAQAAQVLPIAVARWTEFDHSDIPFAATVVCDMIYMSSGLINVIVYALTRPFLLPHRENRGRMVENSINLSFASQHDTPMRTPRLARTPGTTGSFDLRSPHSASVFVGDQDGGLGPGEPFRLVMPLPAPPPRGTFSSPTSDGDDFDRKDLSWHDRDSSRIDKAASWSAESGAGDAL